MNLQTNISNFLPPFWFGLAKNKDRPRISLEGTTPVLLTNQMAAKLQGRKAPPDMCANVGDLQTKVTRKRSSWHWSRLLPPKMLDQHFILQLNMKLSFSLFSFLWHLPEKRTPSCFSQDIAKVDNLWERCIFHLSVMLENLWSISLSLVKSPKLREPWTQSMQREGHKARATRIELPVWSTDP